MIAAALASLLLAHAPASSSPKAATAATAAPASASSPSAACDPAAHASCDGKDEADAQCHHGPAAEHAGAQPTPPAALTPGKALVRGAKPSGKNTVTLAALLANPSAQDGKTVTVEGPVRQACTRKGCWMELAAKAGDPGVRVTFKDYAFFVPTDSAGAHARVEGVVKVAQLTEGTAEHYASEGGTVAQAKDGTHQEVQIVASGVELTR